MKIGKWLDKFRRRDKENLQRRFAENIKRKYEWQQENEMGGVCLCHRKAIKPGTVVQQVNLRQIQQLIQKNMPKTVIPSVTMIQRQNGPDFWRCWRILADKEENRSNWSSLFSGAKSRNGRKQYGCRRKKSAPCAGNWYTRKKRWKRWNKGLQSLRRIWSRYIERF